VKFYNDVTGIYKPICYFYYYDGYFVFTIFFYIEEKRQVLYRTFKLLAVFLVNFLYCFYYDYFI